MVQGPYEKENVFSPCMKNGICLKKYSRPYVTETQIGKDGYPVYRRQDVNNGGHVATLNIRGRKVTIDNRWIVPYSPLLCQSFNAHINVEYCHSVQAIMYICKYINVLGKYFEGNFDFTMPVKAEGIVCSDIIILFYLGTAQIVEHVQR